MYVLFSSSEKSVVLNLPIPPCLVTLEVAAALLPDELSADASEDELKKLVSIDQSIVKGLSSIHIIDMSPPS